MRDADHDHAADGFGPDGGAAWAAEAARLSAMSLDGRAAEVRWEASTGAFRVALPLAAEPSAAARDALWSGQRDMFDALTVWVGRRGDGWVARGAFFMHDATPEDFRAWLEQFAALARLLPDWSPDATPPSMSPPPPPMGLRA